LLFPNGSQLVPPYAEEESLAGPIAGAVTAFVLIAACVWGYYYRKRRNARIALSKILPERET
jgi:hypothetical protein